MRIDAALVRNLISDQFPQWGDLPVVRVEPGGADNRTFRLGDTMAVRLPGGEGYAPQVAIEHRWLPQLAAHLPLPIPVPLALGAPGRGYPYAWSVYPWLAGDTAQDRQALDLGGVATDLATFLVALQRVDTTGAPGPGPQSGYRGGRVDRYDDETRDTITRLADLVDEAAATAVWDEAIQVPFEGPPMWFHGDVAAGNLLVREGRLAAVIDFGCVGVGDPACDLAVAWTLLDPASRGRFRQLLAPDEAMWARGRGWALWKALITLRDARDRDRPVTEESLRVVTAVLATDRSGEP